MARIADGWSRLSRARVAILASHGAGGAPHLVPCCFVVDGLLLYSAVDDKPKASTNLQRLANVAADPGVTVIVHHYEENWEHLWWVRASGTARILLIDADEDRAEHQRAVALLLGKYEQYATHRLDGPVLAVSLSRWRTWSWR